jgi:hypothetical protein
VSHGAEPYVGELAPGVSQQLLDNRVEYELHACDLDRLVTAQVVSGGGGIRWPEGTVETVRVRGQMNCTPATWID